MAYDVTSYQHQHQLQDKLSKLRDFVETHNAQANTQQKQHYDEHSLSRTFAIGDSVWLSVPTAGKLDPKWEGKWIIQSVKSPITYTIHDGRRTRTVHINQLRPRLQAATTSDETVPLLLQSDWAPPSVEHHFIDDDPPGPENRYPTRDRRPPDRYRP